MDSTESVVRIEVAGDAGYSTLASTRSSQPLRRLPPMFESLTQRLSGTIERLRGRGRLTEENIREALREVRMALLEADVALPVVQALIAAHQGERASARKCSAA